MRSLSVIVITKDEVENIAVCLESVRWAQEIIVVDGGSCDDTCVLARAYTDKVYIMSDWQGFGVQKNRALALATQEWVLSLDADERVSPQLAEEIRHVLEAPDPATVYALPRQSYFCGRAMRHSGWSPDFVARLFRRGEARFSDERVHERLLHAAPARRLQGRLLHFTYMDLEEMLEKANQYSSLGARGMWERGERASLSSALGHGLWAFLRTYVLRLGFLDGKEGFLLAIGNAEGTYYRYLKLMYLERNAEQEPQG